METLYKYGVEIRTGMGIAYRRKKQEVHKNEDGLTRGVFTPISNRLGPPHRHDGLGALPYILKSALAFGSPPAGKAKDEFGAKAFIFIAVLVNDVLFSLFPGLANSTRLGPDTFIEPDEMISPWEEPEAPETEASNGEIRLDLLRPFKVPMFDLRRFSVPVPGRL